jgi:hypothetical protein
MNDRNPSVTDDRTPFHVARVGAPARNGPATMVQPALISEWTLRVSSM